MAWPTRMPEGVSGLLALERAAAHAPKPPLEELAAVCAGKPPETLPYRRERPAPGDHGRDGGYPVNGGTALAGAGILRYDAKLGRELL